MSRLVPSRMRPITHTIPLGEARRIVNSTARPLERVERVPLGEARGRVVARAVTAGQDVPPFARAAMDGYAVVASDTRGASRDQPAHLRQTATVYTGEVASRRVSPGECVEISTGAPLPEGADAVVMVEETALLEDGQVRVFTAVHTGQHVGARGADIEKGQAMLSAGTVLNASRIGALAAIGQAEVDVFARPRVAIFSTGNELVEPGHTLGPGQIYDVNRFTLAALLGDHGGVPVQHPTPGDSIEALTHAIDHALDDDVLVFSGGSSVGERDLMIDALALKGEILFHGVAIKPGKPTVFGTIGPTPVFGMSGYPTSCLTNAYLLIVPLLRQMARLPEYHAKRVAAPLGQAVASIPGKHQILTVRLENGVALPVFKASGDITSMSRADGYIEIPADISTVDRDTVVEVVLF